MNLGRRKTNKKLKGSGSKEGKSTRQVRRTQKEKDEGFMRVFLKTIDKNKKIYPLKRKTNDNNNILTAMNTAANSTLGGGKKYKKRKTKKSRKVKRK